MRTWNIVIVKWLRRLLLFRPIMQRGIIVVRFPIVLWWMCCGILQCLLRVLLLWKPRVLGIIMTIAVTIAMPVGFL